MHSECTTFRSDHYIFVVVRRRQRSQQKVVGAEASVQGSNTENEQRQTSAVQVVQRILHRKYIHMAAVLTIFRGTTAELLYFVCARLNTCVTSACARACV